jgi:hypothetical protein
MAADAPAGEVEMAAGAAAAVAPCLRQGWSRSVGCPGPGAPARPSPARPRRRHRPAG